VARVLLLTLCYCALLGAQQKPPAEPPEPPEEDESLKPKEYAFNPVQAKKELTAGNFYFKKGSFRAAATRYLEATRWDPGFAEAFRKLGESSEKARDYAEARSAYTKYVEIAEDQKDAEEIKKRIAKLPKASVPPPPKPGTEPLDKVPEEKLPPNRVPSYNRPLPTRR
jgi:tetratricopeptide (TPR) repeat protein